MRQGHQVLAGAVHDLQHRGVGQQRAQRFVDSRRQRVDQQDFVADGHLHQGQLRPVGAFADEFGIQTHPGGRVFQVRLQGGGVIDPDGHEISMECIGCPVGRQ